jgi:predicted nucleotide-binding protein
VLLTPDDIGGPRGTELAKLQPRARQNVIAELFYFVAKLGRKHVCALKKRNIEIPSDIGGVVYIDMDDGGWKAALLRELEGVGYEIDWGKAMR